MGDDEKGMESKCPNAPKPGRCNDAELSHGTESSRMAHCGADCNYCTLAKHFLFKTLKHGKTNGLASFILVEMPVSS